MLTIQFSRDQPLHQQFDEVTVFASLKLARERQLTSLAVLHVPGDQAADGRPHAHLLILARTHHVSGWAAVHTESAESEHTTWAGEWAAWTQAWRRPMAA